MNGTLIIRPINGNLTRNTDLFRKMDPYVRVILGAQHRQTSVARKAGKHPAWRDELTLKHNTHDDVLNFEVWDEDTNKKDDFVGSGALAIATVQQKGNKTQEWVQLSYKGRDAGQILVDITFIPDNMMKQPKNMMMPTNNMQVMPNQMVQPNLQGTFPMMPNQGMIPQQIPQQPQYCQQNSFQQQQQPILTQQNTYANHLPQQMQMQQGFPQQVQGQQMPTQQYYPQQQPITKLDTFAPPIEQANTMNRNQMRVGTQMNQGGMYQQGNPNQYGHFIPPGA